MQIFSWLEIILRASKQSISFISWSRVTREPPRNSSEEWWKRLVDETDMINNLVCHRDRSMLIYERFIGCRVNKLNSDDPTVASRSPLPSRLHDMAIYGNQYNKCDILWTPRHILYIYIYIVESMKILFVHSAQFVVIQWKTLNY